MVVERRGKRCCIEIGKSYADHCNDGCEANKLLYKKIRNRTKKVVVSAMRKEAEKETKNLREKRNHVFKLVKLMK